MGLTSVATPETLVPPGTWVVDCERSTIGFAVRHVKITKVRGRFRNVEGVIRCDGSDVVSITGSIDVASIDTGDARRDARLRAADFFNVERHPTIGVEAGSSPMSAGEGLTVCGTMTIGGVQRPLELHVEGPATPVNGDGELRIRARGAVSRRAFGLDWDSAFAAGGLLIDDRVVLLLDVVVVRAL
jgi:polyisoprenoid-binding protein YceI